MGQLKEEAMYLRGLADGLELNDSKIEKLLDEMISLLDSIAETVDEHSEDLEGLENVVDEIDEDLGEVEEYVYGDDDDDECGCSHHHGRCFHGHSVGLNCPYCDEKLELQHDDIGVDENGEAFIMCAHCGQKIELDIEEDDLEEDEDEDKD